MKATTEGLGEILGFSSRVVCPKDGSWIAVQTDKPSYYAGETITGRVICMLTTPKQADKVLVKITCKEKVHFESETTSTTNVNGQTHTHYHRHRHDAKLKHCKDIVIVSQVPTMIPAGTWQYPFSYPLRPNLPGCMRWSRTSPAMQPGAAPLRHYAEIVYKMKACMDVAGVQSKDIKSEQELIVNSFFDWNKMQPARAEAHGQVRLLCCIPRGMVHLECNFAKAAFAAGDVAQARATIKNDSKTNVRSMVVKLMRRITLRSSGAAMRTFIDTMAKARYEGVTSMQSVARDMPLPLLQGNCGFLPSVDGRFVDVEHYLQVDCDVPWAPDITAKLPCMIFNPPPAVWGVQAAFGGSLPQGFVMPNAPAGSPVMQQTIQQTVVQQQPLVAGAAAMPSALTV